jgi:hypothetical protein
MPTWGWIVVAAAGGLVAGAVAGFGFAAWLIGMDNPRPRGSSPEGGPLPRDQTGGTG